MSWDTLLQAQRVLTCSFSWYHVNMRRPLLLLLLIGASRIGGSIFNDEVIAAAIIDRLLHHANLSTIKWSQLQD